MTSCGYVLLTANFFATTKRQNDGFFSKVEHDTNDACRSYRWANNETTTIIFVVALTTVLRVSFCRFKTMELWSSFSSLNIYNDGTMGIVRRFCVMDEPVGLLVLFFYFLAWVAI
jgi:hypothetical protein